MGSDNEPEFFRDWQNGSALAGSLSSGRLCSYLKSSSEEKAILCIFVVTSLLFMVVTKSWIITVENIKPGVLREHQTFTSAYEVHRVSFLGL